MKYPLVFLPALAMGISVATAEETDCDCPCEHQRSVAIEQTSDRDSPEREPLRPDRSERQTATPDSMDRDYTDPDSGHDRNGHQADDESPYLANKPADHYFSGNIIGHDVTNRRDDKVVGTVDELLIDQDGKIGAVILNTGGFMGLGEKDIAIPWVQIERELDGDDFTLSVDLSEESLKDAPRFRRD